jgi:hypothetical protein
MQDQQDRGKHRETPHRAFPKSFSESLAEWNAVIVKRSPLLARHQPGCQRDKEYSDGFGR